MQKGKIMQLEERFQTFMSQADKTPDEECVISTFLDFWRHYDTVFHTTHTLAVQRLYFRKDESLTRIALDLHMDDKTLYRYRAQYMECFLSVCQQYGIVLQ